MFLSPKKHTFRIRNIDYIHQGTNLSDAAVAEWEKIAASRFQKLPKTRVKAVIDVILMSMDR